MPSDARYLPLSELAELRTERIAGQKDPNLPYVGLEHIAQGEPLLLSTAPSNSSISTNSVFEAGDILFGKLRPNLRKSLQVEFRGYCSTDFLVLRARQGVYPGFAARVFQSDAVFDVAVQTAIGTKMPRTSWEHLKTLSVFVPHLAKQRRISEILDAADEAIRQTERVIAKLRAVKAGLLHDLLTRGLDEHGRLRDPQAHPEQFKDSPLGRIPREWDVAQFQEYAISSAFGPRFSSDAYNESGNVATLRTTDMDDEGNIDLSTMPIAQLDLDRLRIHLLEVGDILISRSGTCGITAVFPGCRLPVLPGAFLIRFRLSGELHPQLVRSYFNSVIGRGRVLCQAQGGVQKNLQGTALLRLLIPVPPSSEQCQVLRTLETHDARIRAERVALAKLRRIKRGLMDDLLTGRVRVGG
jgi:type I restriction enzyme S subunit